MELIRTFIAIEPDNDARKRIISFTQSIKRGIRGDINWTREENLHFTLKFLGEIPSEKVEEIKGILNRVSIRHDIFRVRMGNVGFFPDSKRPRILWIGVKMGSEILIKLAKRIEEELEVLGFERERREFKAHLTIARIKSHNIKIDSHILKGLDEDICEFEVDKIILYRSDLLPTGARYSKIQEFYLNR